MSVGRCRTKLYPYHLHLLEALSGKIKIEGPLNPRTFKLDVRKIDPIRVPDNPDP